MIKNTVKDAKYKIMVYFFYTCVLFRDSGDSNGMIGGVNNLVHLSKKVKLHENSKHNSTNDM